MEDILFDYHVADAMATLEYGENADYNARLYKLGVLKKHGVTEADFDSSMVYYTRHADRLRSIYENLATRMTNEAMALGADANDVNRYQIADGDTANIWSQPRNIVMMTEAPYNVVSFHTEADSSYHKGDRFVMAYDAKFLYQAQKRCTCLPTGTIPWKLQTMTVLVLRMFKLSFILGKGRTVVKVR